MVDYIQMAVPLFILLIIVEWVLSKWKKQEVYRLNDTVTDLSLGSYSEIVGALMKTLVFAGYYYIYENHRLFDGSSAAWFNIENTMAWAWVACFFLYDHQYYWAHRMSHTMNFLWATHIPHHQSEEYNLSVALRQGAFQGAFFWVFYLPLAFIGFPPVMFIACAQLDTIYQFFIHTRLVGKLGFLEWFMNTPSHHRVHHAQNEKYIDKNHAGVFIIFDRFYGSFKEEEEEPVYGIVSPLRSFNPFWGTVHYWLQLWKLAGQTPYWRDKIQLWFMPPAWRPRGVPPKPPRDEVSNETFKKFNPVIPMGLNFYIFVHFIVLILATTFFTGAADDLPWLNKILFAGYLLFGLVCIGGMFEAKRWVMSTEIIRLAGTAVLFIALSASGNGLGGENHLALTALVAGFAASSIPWLLRYRKHFVNDWGLLPDEAAYPIGEGQAAKAEDSPEPIVPAAKQA